MNYNIGEGVYQVQSGHRKGTAVIHCPYVQHRIEVYESCSLKILDGSEVFWTEIRQLKRKRETVIQAVVVGLKHCPYIYGAKQVICSIKILHLEDAKATDIQVEGHPIDKKLPALKIMNGESMVDWYCNEYPNIEEKSSNNRAYDKIQNKYFWARIVAWNYQQEQPRAVITRLFNEKDVKTVETQTEVILHNLGIDSIVNHDYVKLSNLKKNKQYFPIHGHKEFNKMVFTIDPQQSQDVEDALSIELLSSSEQNQSDKKEFMTESDFNNSARSDVSTLSNCSSSESKKIYQVGVHISDVTSYLPLIEEKREEIARRGSSIYLPQKVINMLPDQIVKMCTLFSNEKRLVLSVLFKIDQDGNLLDEPQFKKSIVRSVAKLSYEEAELIIKDSANASQVEVFRQKHNLTSKQYQLLSEKIRILKTLSSKRRSLRLQFRNHSIPYKNEVTFRLDSDQFPVEMGVKKSLDSEKLIEEFMILTNESVARKLVQDYGQNSLIIHHPKPSNFSISYLNEIFSEFGIRFTHNNVMNLEDQIGKVLGSEGVKEEIKELLLMRAMQIQEHASYTRCMHSAKGHYGLNLQYYTHFTSPLRRFADIIVHEQLLECMKGKRIHTEPNSHSYKKINLKTERLLQQIQYANRARYRNKKLKQKVAECFINMLLYRENKKIVAKGFIMSIGLKSATVYIPGYHIVKEIQWKSPVEYAEREGVKVFTPMPQNPEENRWISLRKNDSVNVQLQSQKHQQIKATILVQGKTL